MSVVASAQVIVTTAGAKVVTPQSFGQKVIIYDRDATVSVFAGPAGLTSSTGTECKAQTLLGGSPIELPPETELWLITASGTARCDILQFEAN